MEVLTIRNESGDTRCYSDFSIYAISENFAQFFLKEKPEDGFFDEVRRSGSQWLARALYKRVRISRC